MLTHRTFSAFLFDMDGTLINSIAAAERIWRRWGLRHGLDVPALMHGLHGMRAIDTVRRWAPPGLDVVQEAARITQEEIEDVEGVVALPGALAFVEALPPERWAIVTSAPRALAMSRLGAAGMPMPDLLISADDVAQGKPAPEGFLLGARRLGVPAGECLIWEDSAAGIAAAEAAGGCVMVVSATHASPISTRHAVTLDYARLRTERSPDGRLRLLTQPAG